MIALTRLAIRSIVELLILPAVLVLCAFSRFAPKARDIGLGPEPIIGAVYHRRALEEYGYAAETFVTSVYFITDEFNLRFDRWPRVARMAFNLFCGLFFFCIFRYRALYLYFSGGPLLGTAWLWRLEPFLLRLAGVKTVLLPYGGDVQDMTRCPNLLFKDGLFRDYPRQHLRRGRIVKNIDLWTRGANHIVAGNDWVDFLYHWHTLMIAHFTIDTRSVRSRSDGKAWERGKTLRILHAPNHRHIKGTLHFERAVASLRAEGYDVELVLIQGRPNSEVRAAIEDVHLVADQLVIGWYAQFAIEGMALGKPVLCWLRPDLKQLYVHAGLMTAEEPPIVECSSLNVRDVLRRILEGQVDLDEIGRRGRDYVERKHSTTAIGATFDTINRALGILPRNERSAR